MEDIRHYELTNHEKYSLTGYEMNGKLKNIHGKVLKKFPKHEELILTVQDILDASDTNLDDLSDVSYSTSVEGDKTMRYSGIMLMFIISYDNTYSTSSHRHPKYTIRINRINYADYKVVELIDYNDTIKLYRERYGISINFIQTGTIGKFNFQASLVTCVSSIGLLSLTTLFVDCLMLFVCKSKKYYKNDKYFRTQQYRSLSLTNMSSVNNLKLSRANSQESMGDAAAGGAGGAGDNDSNNVSVAKKRKNKNAKSLGNNSDVNCALLGNENDNILVDNRNSVNSSDVNVAGFQQNHHN